MIVNQLNTKISRSALVERDISYWRIRQYIMPHRGISYHTVIYHYQNGSGSSVVCKNVVTCSR